MSVSDKAGLTELAKGLHSSGYELVSTGGSAKAIADAGVPVTKVEQLTGFPEMLDGRVKTLHPAVHGGILARRDLPEHTKALAEHGIGAIDVVIVNLYPFRATVTAQPPPEFADGVENIDIGGPAMIRAAAKNHAHVTVIVDPADYQALLDAVGSGDAGGDGSAAFRRRCAWKAFQVRMHAHGAMQQWVRGVCEHCATPATCPRVSHRRHTSVPMSHLLHCMQHCASYDAQVAEWIWAQTGDGPPPELAVPMRLAQGLRYGENPHQQAAFYIDLSLTEASKGGVATAKQHHGAHPVALSVRHRPSYKICLLRTPPCLITPRHCVCTACQSLTAGPQSTPGGPIPAEHASLDAWLVRVRCELAESAAARCSHDW